MLIIVFQGIDLFDILHLLFLLICFDLKFFFSSVISIIHSGVTLFLIWSFIFENYYDCYSIFFCIFCSFLLLYFFGKYIIIYFFCLLLLSSYFLFLFSFKKSLFFLLMVFAGVICLVYSFIYLFILRYYFVIHPCVV